jgi:hypothetical protein
MGLVMAKVVCARAALGTRAAAVTAAVPRRKERRVLCMEISELRD